MINKVFLKNIRKLMMQHITGGGAADSVVHNDIQLFPIKDNNKSQAGDSFLISTPQISDDIPPARKKELESWTLNWDLYVNTDDIDKEESKCDYHLNHKKEILDIYNGWYQQYLREHNGVEMNFLTAMQYLKDNPDEDESIKEFIKKSFGICDGNVSRNQQMGKGSCHLLACRAELEDSDDPEILAIARNIVKQNEDGTVTVTFEGIRDEQGEPLRFTITNEEIKKSYTEFDESTHLLGGSTDPDDAALELGYLKLKEFLINNYPVDYEAKFNTIDTEIKQYETEKKALYSEQDNIIKNVFETGYDKLLEYLRSSDKPEDKELFEFIINNTNGKENDALYVSALMESRTARNTRITYNYFDEDFQCTVIRTSNMQSLMENKIIELMRRDSEFKEQNEQYENNRMQLSGLYKEIDAKQKLRQKIYTLQGLYQETELGSRADLTFKLLTGKGRYVKNLMGEDLRNFLSQNKDNLENIPIQAAGIFYHHAFMFDRPIINTEKNRIEQIVMSNPHNEKKDEDDIDFTLSGNFENTFTMDYNEFSSSFSITIIDKTPDESKEDYFQLPFNYDTY